MVKVINIDTKTRTIHVSNADGDIKTWRTTESGTHFPIKKGESTKEALDKFVEKKRPGAKKESGLDKDKIKAHKQGLIYYDDYAKQQSEKEEKDRKEREQALKDKEDADFHEWQKSNPSKDADVSDIVKSYKEKMAAVGPRASIRKTDRIEADAIKEFMTRKLGADRPYEDYYQYWLNGMDKKTADEFNEIYNESEAREMAFSELASDVDHSGLASGNPTYDELMQWAEKQKAKKAQQQPAKRDIENIPISQLTPAERKILWDREQERYEATQKDIAKDTIKGLHGMVAKTEKLIESAKKTGTQEDVDDLTKYRDELKQSIKELSEIHGFTKKEPERSSQPTSYDLDDAFDEADLGSEWGRAKHRMDFHGVSQYTIKDIIDSGKYEAGDIIEALQSSSHDKIDEMRKAIKNK